MNKRELNIKSSTIELGLELAKDFLGKLISPTIEEVGLLIADNIKYFRFKNQIKILIKAEEYVEKKNIKIKEIPIKILVPLLENASLEENEDLQDKWANMLANLADSESNLQNQIFPYLLSQISIEEFTGLKELSNQESEHIKDIKRLNFLIEQDRKESSGIGVNYTNERYHLDEKINKGKQQGFWISLELFEFSNLERLGLIKQTPPSIVVEKHITDYKYEVPEEYFEAVYDTDDYGFKITELGEKLLKICN